MSDEEGVFILINLFAQKNLKRYVVITNLRSLLYYKELNDIKDNSKRSCIHVLMAIIKLGN